jgi:hypothetical protein
VIIPGDSGDFSRKETCAVDLHNIKFLRSSIFFLNAISRHKPVPFSVILEKIRNATFTREEEADIDDQIDELYFPTIKWLLIGPLLIVFLARFGTCYIGVALLLLSLYLLLGFISFSKDNDRKLRDLKIRLCREKVLFSTDNEKRIGGFIFSALLIVALLYYYVHSYHFVDYVMIHWNWSDSQGKTEILGVWLSLLISLLVILLAPLKVSQTSNIIITEVGIYIGAYFYPWKDLREARIDFFFKRPTTLAFETTDDNSISIDLYRFKIDKSKAAEISALLDTYLKKPAP